MALKTLREKISFRPGKTVQNKAVMVLITCVGISRTENINGEVSEFAFENIMKLWKLKIFVTVTN